MKYVLIIFFSLFSFQVSAGVVKIGYFLMPPFILEKTSAPNGLEGVVVDYFDDHIAPQMGVTFEWKGPLSVPRLTRYLIEGEVHLTPMLSKTSEREKITLFAKEPFISFISGIVFKKDHPLNKIVSTQDLVGSTLIYVLGSPIPPFLQNDDIKFIRVGHKNWAKSNLSVVSIGRADGAYFPNMYEPQYYIAKRKMALKVLKLPIGNVIPYTVFSKKTSTNIIERFNKVNHAAIKNQVFKKYLDQYTK